MNVAITGTGAGSATILASVAGGVIPNTTTNAVVTVPGTIVLPSSGTVSLGQTVAFPVSLATAAPSQITIALVSSDTNRVTVSPSSITIAAGQTTPATQPTVTGINFGAIDHHCDSHRLCFGKHRSSSGGNRGVQSRDAHDGRDRHSKPVACAFGAGAGRRTGYKPEFIKYQRGDGAGYRDLCRGSWTVQVPITAVAAGVAVIHAFSLPSVADTTATVTVQGNIILPASLTVSPAHQATLSVQLGSPAPVNGVTVSLSSSDTSKATVSTNVFIAQGQTTPATNPIVNGVNFGSVTITASANGFGSATTAVQISGSASFQPATLTVVNGSGAKNIALTLSAAVPSSVTFNLSSSNQSAATVLPSVTIPANQTSINVAVTPVAIGQSTITASTSTPNIANTTAVITVTAPGGINLPANTDVGLSVTEDFPISLGTPAPTGGVSVTLTSSNTSKLTVSPGTITIAAGQSSPATLPQITGVDIGSVTITASATGYTTAVAPAQVSSIVSYAPSSLTIVGATTQNFVLTLAGTPPAAGIAVAVSSSNTSVATTPATITFFPSGGGVATANLPVTGVAPGSAVIHVNATPFIPDTTAACHGS